MSPDFSIIVPSYNRADIIGRALKSCLAQTYEDFEIVVVDDGSTDDTEAAIAAVGDPRIRYIRQENAGGAAARNAGADAALGVHFAFLDSDDAFESDKLAAFREAIRSGETDPLETVYYSPLRFHRGKGNEIVRPTRPIKEGETVGEYLFAFDGLLQTSTLVMRREVFLETRFDDSLRNLQDLDLCLRIEAAGKKFVMLPRPYTIWFDVVTHGRISYATKVDHMMAWVERRRALLNDRAYAGFMARYVALGIAGSEPLKALSLLRKGLDAKALSPTRAAMIFARGFAPNAYGRFRDALVVIKSRLQFKRPE